MYNEVWDAVLGVVSSGEVDKVEAREGVYWEHLVGWEMVLPVGNFWAGREAVRSQITMSLYTCPV